MVEDRSANSLLPLIEQYIAPGTEIHSDMWRVYNGISAIPVIPPFTHRTVNHYENFVDPTTGATTNHVERMWKEVKQKFKKLNGTTASLLPSYMDEFVWRQLRENTFNDAFNNILQEIASQLSVLMN